ncbi:MAG: hypothetical protein WC663_00735 [Patescibacteria group bacterium]|jgi:hypothetical protein
MPQIKEGGKMEQQNVDLVLLQTLYETLRNLLSAIDKASGSEPTAETFDVLQRIEILLQERACFVSSDLFTSVTRNIETVLRAEHLNPLRISNFSSGSVSGALLCTIELDTNSWAIRRAIAKFAPGVGRRERIGSELLKPHLLTPTVFPIVNPDLHIAAFVENAKTLHELIISRAKVWTIAKKVLKRNLKMWCATKALKDSRKFAGYGEKLDDTFNLLQEATIMINAIKMKLGIVLDLPLVLNGLELPSLKEMFEIMKENILSYPWICLQHGDEGAGNFLVTSEQNIYAIDNEKVDYRLLPEGIVKFTNWFPEIMASPTKWDGSFNATIKNGQLIIDFETRFELRDYVKECRKYMLDYLRSNGIAIDHRIISAFSMMFFLRAMQWAHRRRDVSGTDRSSFRPYLLGMALKEASKMVKR